MAQDQLKTILKYVKDVLGVDSFAPATSGEFPPQAPSVAVSATKPYLFIGSESSAALLEMQQRMVAALKLQIGDFDFINVAQTKVQPDQLANSKVVVMFGKQAQKASGISELVLGEIKTSGTTKFVLTHALAELSNSAPLKKETWTHLQSVF